jgi:hypothetical protein
MAETARIDSLNTGRGNPRVEMLRRGAGWLAGREQVPTSLRAVLGYYADAGVFDAGSLLLKRRVDATVDAMLADSFGAVEQAIAAEFGYEYVDFEYDTKLLLPANLTLGYLFRRLDGHEHERAADLTHLAVEALLDGDIRDARNDEEFGDFAVDFDADRDDRRRIAAIAQETLAARVDRGLATYPDRLGELYERAVAISERHQDQDAQFREWMAAAREGESDARERIRAEYRDAPFGPESTLFPDADESPAADDPAALTADEQLPYLRTQYDRVGVIYDAMLEMYRAAGFPIAPAFQRSIVLAIIGAQIWLDDIEDYEPDMREGQLTPVTAEYLLADDDRVAREAVVDISHRYLDRARQAATDADSTLTGIAAEYIRRRGSPDQLPGR